MRFIGLDAGSVSVKIVVMDDQARVVDSVYERHRGHSISVAYKNLATIASQMDLKDTAVSITGTAGKTIATILGIRHTNELAAQSYAARKLFPSANTIIEMGGEDSKFIILDGAGIRDFSMNSVCAAGTGSFLDQQAERLRLTIEEFGEMAVKTKNPPRIAGRCSVFAKSDMIHLQQIATPVEDIVAGLCFAVARNFKGTIIKGRTVIPDIIFQGGVALNKGMVRAFREVFQLDNLIVPEKCEFMVAVGAVLKDMEGGEKNYIDLSLIDKYLRTAKFAEAGKPVLIANGDDFIERHVKSAHLLNRITPLAPPSEGGPSEDKIMTYMGVDIGSISTNLAVIDKEGNLLARRYLMTAGRPIEAVMQGLAEIEKEIAGRIEIGGIGTTGSGRYMIADFIGADIVKNEITAQATAAISIDSAVDTIFEIGGQDSKYISIEDGVITDFEMNKACAAGTGSFLEEQAEKLSISIKEEFAKESFSSCQPCNLGERCTVFMENSLMANIQRGAEKNDLLAGLSYSIVENYINRVVAGKKIGNKIFFQGGTAYNKAVVAAFEKFTGQTITVPPNHDVTGAIGMALIARDAMEAGKPSAFKGFSITERPYSVSSFECKSCSNVCEINRVTIEGEKRKLFYGGRCEKYDIKEKTDMDDLFAFREELLWKGYEPAQVTTNGKGKPVLGIPYIFLFHEFLPFWTTLLKKLGFGVVVSPKTNRQVVNLGVETVLSESCFPVKVAHGHVKWLLEQGIEHVFLPSFVNISAPGEDFSKGSPCPYTQTMPYLSKAAFKHMRLYRPIIDFTRGDKYLIKQLKTAFRAFSPSSKTIEKALKDAKNAQEEFYIEMQERGSQILTGLAEKTIVIIGRPYNSFDSGVNLQIPKKLASLNVLSIPMDMLPLARIDISDRWQQMYWRSGQRIIKAARYIKDNPYLYPIYIGNFNCGPDSFILKYFKDELGDKPFLHLEIDEHSADAGAITRCEAFLDSIENRKIRPSKPVETLVRPIMRPSKDNIIYIPRMSDHAFAIAGAFEYAGIASEVLPPSDSESIALGRKHVSGKECYPCAVTTGDMLRKVFSKGFDAGHSAFFMPSGTGPCRFGQYNVFQRLLLDNIGLKDIQLFSPVQDSSFYADLGIAGGDFITRTWKGIVAIELLTKCLHETRPYETEKGRTKALYNKYLMEVYDSIRCDKHKLTNVLKDVRAAFEAVPVDRTVKRPAIGVVGEIFVRSNKFSNENLIEKIEALGGEAWLAPVEEWIYYVNYFGLKHALIKKDYSATIDIIIKRLYKKNVERQYHKHFKGFLKTLHEPDTRMIIKKARPYVDESFEGETILSIGKSVDLAERGVGGIVNTMPFGCMPGTIVSALMRALSRDYSVPSISIPYDGTESNTTVMQLETFMEQIKNNHNGRQHSG
ncbi:MAG: acyl-CoA dehydratase activase [Candidatus Magnetominusculus sp. LBB02]|nr:acyl-CoA dehydratase activase [Candidatus Magnetominusculus sp. LBB02]